MNNSAERVTLAELKTNGIVGAVEEQGLYSLYRIFKDTETRRVALQTRQSHLLKQVTCPTCAKLFGPKKAIWIPNKTVKSCPHCTTCGRNISIFGQHDDEDKKNKKQIPDVCPHCEGKICKETEFIPTPKTDLWVEMFLPRFIALEQELKTLLENKVGDHPLWTTWGVDVVGLGKTTLGRIMGMCDITLLPTITKMWAHAGLGNKDGQPQRRRKGQPLDYNDQLRAAFHLLGESLIRQKGAYYKFYLLRKKRAEQQELTKLHCHNRARRDMLKIAASHIWRIWREVEGLEAPLPYVIEYLGHTSYLPPNSCTGKELGEFVTLPKKTA
jgi:hypothetical protein